MSTTIIKLKSKHKPLQVINPAGDLFESFAAYKGMEGESLSNLRNETAHILSFCNKHDDTKAKSVTHLAFGYVQSGKTMSFTALTAMARDNGYRLIVYLLVLPRIYVIKPTIDLEQTYLTVTLTITAWLRKTNRWLTASEKVCCLARSLFC